MLQSSSNNLKIDINQEISKAFQNVNYSQWERQKQTLPTKKPCKPILFFSLLNLGALHCLPIFDT